VTHYEVLGVPPDAEPSEIRRAYLALARRNHPDYFAGAAGGERAEAERRMRAINEAWAVLGDGARRRAYDREQGLLRASPGDPADDVFVPFEVDDAGGVDPRTMPDVPYRTGPPSPARGLAVLLPVALFALGVAVLVSGLFLGLATVAVPAVVILALAGVSFVALPLVTLTEARRSTPMGDDPDPDRDSGRS
jgi:hypothetical protein